MKAMTVAAVIGLAMAARAGAVGFPEIEGWKPAGAVSSWGPDDLGDYVDGAADLFLDYGFQGLATREIESGGVRVTVEVYEMGSPLDAYGVFTSEADGTSVALPIGAGAVVSPPYQCLLAKDRYYVKVDVEQGELSSEMGEALVRTLARSLPGEDGPPPELGLLPSDQVVAGSARYSRKQCLELPELPHCVSAIYARGDDTPAQVFLLVPGEGQSQDAIWQRLSTSWAAVRHPGRPILALEVPDRGLIGVIRSQRALVGVTGCTSRQELVSRLEALAR